MPTLPPVALPGTVEYRVREEIGAMLTSMALVKPRPRTTCRGYCGGLKCEPGACHGHPLIT